MTEEAAGRTEGDSILLPALFLSCPLLPLSFPDDPLPQGEGAKSVGPRLTRPPHFLASMPITKPWSSLTERIFCLSMAYEVSAGRTIGS